MPQRHNILVVGQSHVAAIRAAAKARREAFPDEPRTRAIHTLEANYVPELELAEGDCRHDRFGPSLRRAIEDQIFRHAPRVASVIGGNAHNTLALLRHARPFDFQLDGPEGLPIDPDAERVPIALVRATLEQQLRPDIARLRLLAELAGPFVHIECPPPLRDGAYIAAYAEPWFRNRAAGEVAVADAGLRWRMWRLASQVMRQAAEAVGATFLPVPREVCDPDGFLRQEFASDPTHGNGAYGSVLIRALDAG